MPVPVIVTVLPVHIHPVERVTFSDLLLVGHYTEGHHTVTNIPVSTSSSDVLQDGRAVDLPRLTVTVDLQASTRTSDTLTGIDLAHPQTLWCFQQTSGDTSIPPQFRTGTPRFVFNSTTLLNDA